jgi:hypothetical protein
MLHWIKRWGLTAPETPKADPPAPKQPSADVAGKYAALYKYLNNRYSNVVVLTFVQMEDLLGFALPDLARTHQGWWTMTDANAAPQSCSMAWTRAGMTAKPNLLAQNVVFERGL